MYHPLTEPVVNIARDSEEREGPSGNEGVSAELRAGGVMRVAVAAVIGDPMLRGILRCEELGQVRRCRCRAHDRAGCVREDGELNDPDWRLCQVFKLPARRAAVG